MRLTSAAALVAVLAAASVTAGCSSNGGLLPSVSGSSGPAAVDQFCTDVDQFIAKVKNLPTSATRAETQEVRDQAKSLAERFPSLTAQVVADPAAAGRLKDCLQRLEKNTVN
jgi:outer membrane murein-binding lipoprotein Lpp